jgi:protein-disulfide isomerase
MNNNETIELDTKQVGIISLLLGIMIGGFTVSAVAITNPDLGSSPSPEKVFTQISNDLDLNTGKVMQCYQESDNNEAIEDRNNAITNLGGLGTPTFFIGNKEKGFVKIAGAQPLSRFEEAINTVQNNSSDGLTHLEGIELEGEPSKGSKNASIKIVEYSEFGCPFCAEWHGVDASKRIPIDALNVAESLERQYIDTDKVELIAKDYPSPRLHPNGVLAHKAANCVYREEDEDSYWQFYEQLFEERDRWMQG